MYQKEKKISLFVVLCDSDGNIKCSGTSQPAPSRMDAQNANPYTPSQPAPSIALGSQSQVGSSPECNSSMPFTQSQVEISQNSRSQKA
jgi:hypothetical protein